MPLHGIAHGIDQHQCAHAGIGGKPAQINRRQTFPIARAGARAGGSINFDSGNIAQEFGHRERAGFLKLRLAEIGDRHTNRRCAADERTSDQNFFFRYRGRGRLRGLRMRRISEHDK